MKLYQLSDPNYYELDHTNYTAKLKNIWVMPQTSHIKQPTIYGYNALVDGVSVPDSVKYLGYAYTVTAIDPDFYNVIGLKQISIPGMVHEVPDESHIEIRPKQPILNLKIAKERFFNEKGKSVSQAVHDLRCQGRSEVQAIKAISIPVYDIALDYQQHITGKIHMTDKMKDDLDNMIKADLKAEYNNFMFHYRNNEAIANMFNVKIDQDSRLLQVADIQDRNVILYQYDIDHNITPLFGISTEYEKMIDAAIQEKLKFKLQDLKAYRIIGLNEQPCLLLPDSRCAMDTVAYKYYLYGSTLQNMNISEAAPAQFSAVILSANPLNLKHLYTVSATKGLSESSFMTIDSYIKNYMNPEQEKIQDYLRELGFENDLLLMDAMLEENRKYNHQPEMNDIFKKVTTGPDCMAFSAKKCDNDVYLAIQQSDEGWDYALYDHNYRLLDGGIIESNVNVEIVAIDILRDLECLSYKQIDYEQFNERASDIGIAEIMEVVEKHQNQISKRPNKDKSQER